MLLYRMPVDNPDSFRVNVEYFKKTWEFSSHAAATLCRERKRRANRCYGRLVQTCVIIYL